MPKKIKNAKSLYRTYAAFYDLIYSDINYKKECDLAESFFLKHSPIKPRNILDLGCGTGKHAVEFARRGYKVAALDASIPMLAVARKNAKKASEKILFRQSRLPNINVSGQYDAATIFSAVLNWLEKPGDLPKTFKNVRSRLNEGAILFTDLWNGEAAPKLYKPIVWNFYKRGNLRLIKISETEVNEKGKKAIVAFNYFVSDPKRGFLQFKEKYPLILFTAEEMADALKKSGFRVLHIGPLLNPSRQITDNDFHMTIVAKVV